jgi:ribose 5-phosphate isomerase A
VDRLGTQAPVPVEVVAFGLEATQAALEALGASVRLRLSPAGVAFVTDSGNHILDCSFGPIADPARLEERIGRVVGVVESGLFISRADPVFVADAAGVHRLDSARAHRGSPPILVIMGVSGAGKSTVAQELAARLGWPSRRRRAPSRGERRQDACRNPADRCRPPALARARGRLDRRSARPQAAGHHHLLRAQASPIAGSSSAIGRKSGWSICAAAATSSPGIWRGARAISCREPAAESRSIPSRNRTPDEDALVVDVGPPAAKVAEEIIRCSALLQRSARCNPA